MQIYFVWCIWCPEACTWRNLCLMYIFFSASICKERGFSIFLFTFTVQQGFITNLWTMHLCMHQGDVNIGLTRSNAYRLWWHSILQHNIFVSQLFQQCCHQPQSLVASNLKTTSILVKLIKIHEIMLPHDNTSPFHSIFTRSIKSKWCFHLFLLQQVATIEQYLCNFWRKYILWGMVFHEVTFILKYRTVLSLL